MRLACFFTGNRVSRVIPFPNRSLGPRGMLIENSLFGFANIDIIIINSNNINKVKDIMIILFIIIYYFDGDIIK